MAIAHPTTIGMRPAGLEDWLTRNPKDAPALALRAKLIAEKPKIVMALLPAGEAAVMELGRTLSGRDGWACPDTASETLAAVGRNYVDDICVLIKPAEGPYILAAGVMCFPNRWHITEKIGKPMLQVHAPVPEYADKLASQVDFFLDRLRPGRCFKRGNWGIASVPDLHLPDPVPPVNPGTDANFYVRHEGQSFLKLPETGAVIFGIRTKITAWADTAAEDREAVLGFAKTLGPEWLKYKSISA
ncbi:MAG: DUF3445 domain-containing protein [Rhodospirillaceae bacterium]|nr:DUF3445 domain-containing protein [Rhodospirillaceae bacterium]